MSITPATNYLSGLAFNYATADSDQFDRTHVEGPAYALDNHDHTLGKGLAVGRLNVTNSLTNAGDVYINSADFTYRDNQGSPANHTIMTLDIPHTVTAAYTFSGNITLSGNDTLSGNNTYTGNNDFSGAPVTTGLKVPTGAGAAPTTSGVIAYDSTANQFVGGVNGATKTVLTTGATVTVAQGGTGASTLTAHGILLGEGTSAVSNVAVGTTNQVLIGQTGADPIWTGGTGGPITFQNSADSGKKFQAVASSGIFWNFTGSASVSWPATFGSTPTAVATPASGFGSAGPMVGLTSITTTSLTVQVTGTGSSGTTTVEVWGIG